VSFERERVEEAGTAGSECFLCASAGAPCDLPSVEGTLLRVVPAAGQAAAARVTLATASGAAVEVVLPDHTRELVRDLAALPSDHLRTLHARVFHLLAPARTSALHGSHARLLGTTEASALVLEPDLLLNITDINNAEYCVRQYPLRRMVPSAPTAATLRGNIVHSAFKELLKSGSTDVPGQLEQAVQARTTDLALCQLGTDAMLGEALPHLEALRAWRDHERANLWGRAPEIRAETFLLAPEVGMKGRLDFLLQDAHGDALLELKTGQATGALPKRAHRWQVHGYQTLLAARRPHDQRWPGATLLYSGTPGRAEAHGIPFVPRDLTHVLDLRNRLALVHATGLVPPPPAATKCARCALRSDCGRASVLLGWQPPELEEATPPLAADEVAWFAEAYEQLRLEGLAAEATTRALWQMPAEERCALGLALGGLELDGEPEQRPNGEWTYRFHCENRSELRAGDEVLLSDGDPVRGAVVSGTILSIDARSVTVWTPERIARPSLLDRRESDIVHARTVRNLWRWLEAEPRLRALVAGTREPRFTPRPDLDDLPAAFNQEQREAVARALAAEDFLLIEGPPGTGKTAVVAEIARRAMARGERVLVAAFTNQAVDNVLARLVAYGADDIVRLGHEQAIADELRRFRLDERAHRLMAGAAVTANGGSAADVSPEQLRAALRSAPLVAATTATWSSERYDVAGEALRFDLAIVDEASQLTVPALLGALRFARRFVLVGDAAQLPPLVVSEEAAARGLKTSLFEALGTRWGAAACVRLRSQYRMHPLICGFPSETFYGGGLRTAGEAAHAMLAAAVSREHPYWPVLAPERPLVFVDVPAGAEESAGKVSLPQARLVRRLVRALLDAGVPPEHIGAIAPYRAQVAAIAQRLEEEGAAVTVDTVDRFQGGERPVIVFAFGGVVEGLSGQGQRGLDFLAEPRRLNVALTRAQRKLILIGERQRLERVPLLARLVAYCAELYGGRGGIVTARTAWEP
jgi:DNA replication ATP-dependent helicase Dna2